MGHPPHWIADKIGIRITLYGGGFCGYLLCQSKAGGKKLAIYTYLFWWHLKLCPEDMGLRKQTNVQ